MIVLEMYKPCHVRPFRVYYTFLFRIQWVQKEFKVIPQTEAIYTG